MVKKYTELFSFKKVRDWYAHFERPISSLSLIGGFVFDALALTQVDRFMENFWIVVHLLAVAICIILIDRQEIEGTNAISEGANPEKLHFWLITILQFFFGGLLSTFLVFYFRSAVLAVSWPFFLILVIAFVANERLKRHYARISFQIGFLFLSIFLFCIFLVPLFLHKIGPIEFLLSGAISLVVIGLFLMLLRAFSREKFSKEHKGILSASIIGLYLLVNALYFLHLIPPLPLSLQDAGIYHSITKNAGGEYVATEEAVGGRFARIESHFHIVETYHITPGTLLYAYSAIYSPVAFNTTITHDWQHYDTTKKAWVDYGEVELPVVGGREGGYRTYSIMTGLSAGKWRVNIKTSGGELIGRLTFDLVIQDANPPLETVTKS